jgi:hypothetical protein
MYKKVIWFLKNDVVFWLVFVVLTIGMVMFVLKKEDIKITITFSKPYNNRVVTISGDD